MSNYIVRIYRGEKNSPRTLIGVVEEVGSNGKKAFTNINDLWEILNPADKSSKRCKSKKNKLPSKGVR
jgi:hypothetical protein